jgi:hypothetical protein
VQANVIASAPLPCEYAIPPVPTGDVLAPDRVQAIFTAPGGAEEEFPRALSSAQCGGSKGWSFDDNNAPKNVHLCSQACERVKQGGGISISFGCVPSVVLQ